ncbi:MAG: TIGR04053 family radical SAM/SPASM domain-containing protein [Chloroflexota bacterium]|nr:TIGR04053 family radical SAM/SPASM domain-containing protein [Chloroflexota bacterium]
MATARGASYQPARGSSFLDWDFDQAPFTLAWEITQACALACVHCRATAQPYRDPRELSTSEGVDLIDQIVDIGGPILVITGGDPMMRDDVYDLLDYAVGRGLRVALSPSATGRVTRRALERVKDTGTHMIHLSLDGSRPEIHDAFRGVRGSFDRTLSILKNAEELGFLIQIGTTVTRHNVQDLEAIAEQVARWSDVWTLFFLVPTGRGREDQMLTPAEHEEVLNWLYGFSKRVPFHVRSIAAQQYRRIVIQGQREANPAKTAADSAAPPRWELTGAGFSVRGQAGPRPPSMRGVNDGNGFCFVSHIGEVYPSGFLQLKAGSVREQSLADIYRGSQLFRELRNSALLKGKCGVCEFRDVCGGSRARAYAVLGDYLAADPTCPYLPATLAAAKGQ